MTTGRRATGADAAVHSHLHRGWRDLPDLPPALSQELERFFVFYNEQRGQRFTPLGRRGSARAHELLALSTCRE